MPAATLDRVPDRLLGRVLLLHGPEEFLNERAVEAARAAVRAIDAEAEVSETTGDRLTLGELGELSAPSLFSSTRCVVVRRLEDLPDESVDAVVAYAETPVDDVALVLCHSGGQRGSGVLARLRKAGVLEMRSEKIGPRDLPGFVAHEMRRHATRVDPDAAGLLIQAVGTDLRALAAACHQLASDVAVLQGEPTSGGHTVGVDVVRRYFGGRAEAKSFTIADHVLFGRSAAALEELRWGLATSLAPVLVTSAISGSLRQMAKVATAGSGRREADLVKEVGAPGWKLRMIRDQLRGWDGDRLAVALRLVARADADIKGRSGDASWALEQMVLSVSGLVDRR